MPDYTARCICSLPFFMQACGPKASARTVAGIQNPRQIFVYLFPLASRQSLRKQVSMNPKPLEQSQRAQKNRRDHYALCSVCGLLGQHKQTIVFEAPERGTENGLPAPESQWHRLGCSVLCPQLAL